MLCERSHAQSQDAYDFIYTIFYKRYKSIGSENRPLVCGGRVYYKRARGFCGGGGGGAIVLYLDCWARGVA
jgi:hypothetical protein